MTDKSAAAVPTQIWCSAFLNETRLQKDIDYEISTDDPDLCRQFYNMLRDGKPIELAHVPSRLFWQHKLDRPKRPVLGDVFKILNRTVIISERFKTLLNDHQIGQTQVFEVPLFDDGVEVTDRRFFVWNLAEVRQVAVPEKSPPAQLGKHGLWWIPDIKCGSIVGNPAAMDGLDLVFEPKFDSTVFFSDRLAKAMKAEKIKPLSLVKCVADLACSR